MVLRDIVISDPLHTGLKWKLIKNVCFYTFEHIPPANFFNKIAFISFPFYAVHSVSILF